ncbi:5-methyltetrahydrofolate--homocysteine methyltransferase [Sesbania bispinosa]|nr:5-methyltetrahydrofolate--homocysteine methyltransferase [Sesbania bispinosa]
MKGCGDSFHSSFVTQSLRISGTKNISKEEAVEITEVDDAFSEASKHGFLKGEDEDVSARISAINDVS